MPIVVSHNNVPENLREKVIRAKNWMPCALLAIGILVKDIGYHIFREAVDERPICFVREQWEPNAGVDIVR